MSLSDDQFRFIMANVAGFGLASLYKYVPKNLRREFHFLPGIFMVYYCFGKQAHSLIIFSGISYLVCKYSPWKNVQYLSLFTSIAFLSYAHLTRQILDYGGYVLDISGPFMIAVQKITSLGFCLHDGGFFKNLKNEQAKANLNLERNDSNNNDDDVGSEGGLLSPTRPQNDLDRPDVDKQKVIKDKSESRRIREEKVLEERRKLAVMEAPDFIDYMGYFFHFPSVLCGPIVYYNDYQDFMDQPRGKAPQSGRWFAVVKKLSISIGCAIMHLTLNPMFDVYFLRTLEFQINTPLIIRFGYVLILTILSRLKYYVAWHLGEVLSNVQGLGFNGYDSNGQPRWDLLSNMDLWKFETCLNMREAILAWNKTTQIWLRRTAYDRVPRKFSVLATYTLSAIWHGFYPGYYMTFFGGALFTIAARNGRRLFRPTFQKGKLLPRIYDVITFILTRLTIAYIAFPFVILDFKGSYDIYKSLYFSLHIMGIITIMLGSLRTRRE